MKPGHALISSVDFGELARQAQAAPAYKALVAGGLIFSIGLIVKFGIELQRLRRGEPVDWLAPVAQFCALFFFLACYPRFVPGAIAFLTHLGIQADLDTLADLSRLRADRMREFYEANSLSQNVAVTLRVSELYAVFVGTRYLHLASDAAIMALRALQAFGLAVLVEVGPILLAASWLGGWFRPLAGRWALAVVELCSWTWILSTLVRLCGPAMRQHYQASGQAFNLSGEFSFALASLALLASVPVLGRLVMRQASQAYSAQRSGSAVASGMAAVHRARTQPSSSALAPTSSRASSTASVSVQPAALQGMGSPRAAWAPTAAMATASAGPSGAAKATALASIGQVAASAPLKSAAMPSHSQHAPASASAAGVGARRVSVSASSLTPSTLSPAARVAPKLGRHAPSPLKPPAPVAPLPIKDPIR